MIFQIIQINPTLDDNICTRSNGTNIRNQANEMKVRVLTKIVGKIEIDRIKSQQITESCCIQPINEWEGEKKKRMGRTCNKNGS